MKNIAVFLLAVFLFFIAGCSNTPSEKTYSAQLPLIDDFNRADSLSLGGFWKEYESDPAVCMISNNMLRITGFSTNYFMLEVLNIKPFQNHRVTMALSGEYTNFDFSLKVQESWAGNGYYFNMNSAYGVYLAPITNGGCSCSPMSFTYHQGHVYEITITVAGPIVTLNISNRNTAQTNHYSIANNAASSYGCLDIDAYQSGTNNVMRVFLDEFRVEEQ